MQSDETLRNNVVMVFVLAAAFLLVTGFVIKTYLFAPRPQEERRDLKCRNNLRQLGMALQQYIDGPGGHRFYPYPTQDREYVAPSGRRLDRGEGFSGASFLAALYWSGILTEANIFICPCTSDDNFDGERLGMNPAAKPGEPNRPGWNPDFEKPNGSHVSYASKAQWTMPRGEPLTKDSLPTDTVIASDDTDGKPNHENGFSVLYNDTHVDFLNTIRVESGDRGMVGREAPLDMIGN